jgi:hypothetical protein
MLKEVGETFFRVKIEFLADAISADCCSTSLRHSGAILED